jgi:mRNA interferase RelE/StbE
MNWKIEIKPIAEKYYSKLNKPTKKRVKEALQQLGESKNPLFNQNVKPLTGQLKGDYRLRVGDWRILFTPDKEQKIIYVYAIFPRGETHKD